MLRNLLRQQFGLVETAPPAPLPVERHRDDEIVTVVDGQGAIHEARKSWRQRPHPGILKEMDEAAQGAIVKTEAGGAVETEQAGTAKRADPVGVEWERVLERRVAGGAEIIGFERFRGTEAIPAEGNARETIKRRVANAAFCGEEKRKNSVRDRP